LPQILQSGVTAPKLLCVADCQRQCHVVCANTKVIHREGIGNSFPKIGTFKRTNHSFLRPFFHNLRVNLRDLLAGGQDGEAQAKIDAIDQRGAERHQVVQSEDHNTNQGTDENSTALNRQSIWFRRWSNCVKWKAFLPTGMLSSVTRRSGNFCKMASAFSSRRSSVSNAPRRCSMRSPWLGS